MPEVELLDQNNQDTFMALRCVIKMFAKGIDWCAQPLEQGIHVAATTPALGKLFAGKSLVAHIRGAPEALGIRGLGQPAKS